MSGANRNGVISSGGNGSRWVADVGIGLDLIATSTVNTGGIHFFGSHSDANHDLQTPTTGFTITIANNIWHEILDPTGTLATGTITMPAGANDGQVVNVRTSAIITALTVSPNTSQFIKGNPSTLAAGGIMECVFHAANSTWYC
jgi:hypothetical protein